MKSIKKVLYTVLFILLVSICAYAQDSIPSNDPVLVSTAKKYESITNLSASFSQINIYEEYQDTIKTEGNIYIANPGELKMEYIEPEGDFIYSGKKKIKIYSKESNQLIIKPLEEGNLLKGNFFYNILSKYNFTPQSTSTGDDYSYKAIIKDNANNKGNFAETIDILISKKYLLKYLSYSLSEDNKVEYFFSNYKFDIADIDKCMTIIIPEDAVILEN